MRDGVDLHAIVNEDESVWWAFGGEAVPKEGDLVRSLEVSDGGVYRVVSVVWFVKGPGHPASARVNVVRIVEEDR